MNMNSAESGWITLSGEVGWEYSDDAVLSTARTEMEATYTLYPIPWRLEPERDARTSCRSPRPKYACIGCVDKLF